jgi:hypothetical protein
MRFVTFPETHTVWVTLVATNGNRSATVKTSRLRTGQLHPPAIIRVSSRQQEPFYCDHVEVSEGGGKMKRHAYPLTVMPGEGVTIR